MKENIRKASKRSVSAIVAISIIAVMFLALFPASAGPGPAGATVTGKVTDINDGKAIENAKVVISYHGIDRSVLTDENGKYTFMNVPECFCLKTIKVTKDGYRPETKEVGVSGITVVNFQLMTEEKEPYFGSIVGTVTDLENGEPLEDAKVVLEYHEYVRETFTDADGEYRFDEVPECFCLKKVTASKEHYSPESQEVGVSGETVVDFELMIEEQVPSTGTLHGTVTDASTGEPIPGALVEVTHEGMSWETLTDEQGGYILTEIEMCRCPKFVSFSAEGYESQEGSAAIGQDTEMNIALEPLEDQGSTSPTLPSNKGSGPMNMRPYILASMAIAGTGLAVMGYRSYMVRV